MSVQAINKAWRSCLCNVNEGKDSQLLGGSSLRSLLYSYFFCSFFFAATAVASFNAAMN